MNFYHKSGKTSVCTWTLEIQVYNADYFVWLYVTVQRIYRAYVAKVKIFVIYVNCITNRVCAINGTLSFVFRFAFVTFQNVDYADIAI